MIQGNNYKKIEYLRHVCETIYNSVAIQNAKQFGLHESIKPQFLDTQKELFINKVIEQFKLLGVEQDVRNLNLQYLDFIADDEELKHMVLTLGRIQFNIEGLYDNDEDNKILMSTETNEINNVIDVVLNEYNPLIKATIGKVKFDLSKNILRTETDGYELNQITMPAFVQSLEDNGLLETVDTPLTSFSFNGIGNYTDYLSGNTTAAANDISEFMSNVSKDDLQRVWNEYFTNVDVNAPSWEKLALSNLKYEDYNDIFIVYGFTINMIDNKINNELSMTDYNNQINLILNFLTFRIKQRLTVFLSQLMNETVIIGTDGKNVYVNGIIFKKAMLDGITVDTVFGSVLGNSNFKSLESLKVNNGSLTDSWSKYIKQQTILNNNSFNNDNLISLTNRLTSVGYGIMDNKQQVDTIVGMIDKDDLGSIENTVKLVILAMVNRPMISSFYNLVEKLKSSDTETVQDINFYAALASYILILNNNISKIVLTR